MPGGKSKEIEQRDKPRKSSKEKDNPTHEMQNMKETKCGPGAEISPAGYIPPSISPPFPDDTILGGDTTGFAISDGSMLARQRPPGGKSQDGQATAFKHHMFDLSGQVDPRILTGRRAEQHTGTPSPGGVEGVMSISHTRKGMVLENDRVPDRGDGCGRYDNRTRMLVGAQEWRGIDRPSWEISG